MSNFSGYETKMSILQLFDLVNHKRKLRLSKIEENQRSYIGGTLTPRSRKTFKKILRTEDY
jgi:hypothetical protein